MKNVLLAVLGMMATLSEGTRVLDTDECDPNDDTCDKLAQTVNNECPEGSTTEWPECKNGELAQLMNDNTDDRCPEGSSLAWPECMSYAQIEEDDACLEILDGKTWYCNCEV